MAESVCSYLLKQQNIQNIAVQSAAAHRDEIGNPPYYLTCEKLKREGIPLVPHRARLLTKEDGKQYDLLIGMDEYNVRDMRRIVGEEYSGKVYKLLDFTPQPRSVADPWYTRDFDRTYEDICEGLQGLFSYLKERGVFY